MTNKTFEKYKLVIDAWHANGFNGVKAYQKIYPKAKDKTADKRFRELTAIDRIKKYSDSLKEVAKKVLKTSHEALLRELELWAYSDITETISLTPEQVKELPIEIRRLITKFKETTRQLRNRKGEIYETVKVLELSFVSKERAMEMIHKHTGFYGEHNYQKAAVLSTEERRKRIAALKAELFKEG